uniref:RING-type domain-containing protein n=1 Tax=Sinocyclocheilus grahami TaxID=75366 RepID=A0A672NRH4_SINGR
LRRNVLKGISAQIVSAAVRLLPLMLFCLISIFLISDQNQALRLCLGTTATGAEYGAVSALSINHDCTRLLCGFAKGQITMWDLANGKLLRTITDAHPPGTAILHVKFTDHPALAVCNDSGGSVFELSFRRVMGMRTCESRCLFSGSKGEVCCVEPLHAGPELKDHPITHYSLLAMASLTKILLIGLKPSLKVWLTFPYGKTDPASVPLLAWQFVAVQKTINPVLAFCRGDTIHFLLVKKDESGIIHVIKHRQLQLSCDLISLSWINPRTLVLMDSTEKLRVVDRPSQEELETVDMAELQLVYNSSHFKSLATGGNVSQALALVGEKTCYQSVCSYAGQIMYLGTKSVHIMTLRNWRERVDHLLKQEKFMEALSLAWSLHEGTAKAVLGLFADPAKRKGVVADKMVEILLQYVDRSLKKCPEQGKIQVMEQHFQDMVPVMVDYYEHVVMGNKLLVYISCCLAGRAYPLGDIPEDLVPQVKNQVFEFLIRLHSVEAAQEEEVYPYIRTLLHFDTREFLNVLALTFEDFKNDKQALEYQQRIVDILLKVMVDNSDFTPSQVGCLFTFLARQLAKPDNTLFVNRKLFDQVNQIFLCAPVPMAEDAYQICEFMYDKKHLYNKIVDCYLKDPLRKEELFNYIHNILSMPGYSSEEKQLVWVKALQHIKVSQTRLQMICPLEHTPGRESSGFRKLISDPNLIRPFSLSFCSVDGLLDLLCQFSPQQVTAFLKTSQDYRLEEAIQITEKHKLHEAAAYLLEKKGNVQGAFEVLLQKVVDGIISQQTKENHWCIMNLAEGPVSPDCFSLSSALKELTMKVLNSMSSFIAPPAIIQRILQDPVYGKGKLAEIQGLILGMLETFNYEQTLLETTTNLLNSDLHWSLSHLRKAVSRGLHPRQYHCNICLQQYKRWQESEEEIIIFSCGHLYHCQCLQRKEVGVLSERQYSWSCYKCTSNQGSRPADRPSAESSRSRSTSLAQVSQTVTFQI